MSPTIIAEVNSFVDLVLKLTAFAAQLQDGWYKRSAELDTFQDQVAILATKHRQWTDQLRRYGLSEDEGLSFAVKLALQVLDKQEQHVEKLQKSRFLRWRKRAFPSQLSYSLERILKMVDAGPQLLGDRVANLDLLERNGGQTPAPLPFIPDKNYVPISNSIQEIQTAVEDGEGQRVVTVYGGPGLGKSSAVKYLALHYQEKRTFPDGVYYLFCGQGAKGKIQQLQRLLMECLGFGAASTAPPNDLTAVGVQEGEYFELHSTHTRLRSRLLHQKLLIVLDDVWEQEVLEQLLVPAKGVKYLVTSQNREIWGAAERIQLKHPSRSEGRQILANYTEGLPKKGQFPDSIQDVTDAVVKKLEYHPLSLANVGISVNRKRATDASHWEAINDNILVFLDENDCKGSPVVFERPYHLAVETSMMLMVESLPPEVRQFLFLIALFKDQKLPEPLLKFFSKFLQTVQANDFLSKFDNHEKYLEDRSLVELHISNDRANLVAHSLRMHYIREKKRPEVRSIASHIVANTDESVELIKRGDGDGTLVTILSVLYFAKPFTDIVRSTFEKHLRIINDGVIHRSINSDINALDFVEPVGCEIKPLVSLLNVDHGGPDWRQQAHAYAKKIIIKLACHGELDDDSMAGLLQLPHTTRVACLVLEYITPLWGGFCDESKSFSRANEKTMKTLLALLQDNAILTRRRPHMDKLLRILQMQSIDTIVSVAAKWMEILAMDSNPALQIVIEEALENEVFYHQRLILVMIECTGILEVIWELFISSQNSLVRKTSGKTLCQLSRLKCSALKIANMADVLAKLFNSFISKEPGCEFQLCVGYILRHLACIPEIRNKLRVVDGALEGLGEILANMEGTWQEFCKGIGPERDCTKSAEKASVAASILAEMALENELRATIASLPRIKNDLLLLQNIEMARLLTHTSGCVYHQSLLVNSTRALTILYPDHADPSPLERIKEVSSVDGGCPSRTSTMAGTYAKVYWTRVVAHVEMGAYKPALENMNLAQHHFDQTLCAHTAVVPDFSRIVDNIMETLREIRIYLQMKLKNYEGALSDVNKAVEKSSHRHSKYLTWRGIVKRVLGDLQGALDDLNAADVEMHWTNLRDDNNIYARKQRYDILKNRGYVRYLMGDERGAREDAETAEIFFPSCSSNTNFIRRFVEPWMSCWPSHWSSEEESLNFLGYLYTLRNFWPSLWSPREESISEDLWPRLWSPWYHLAACNEDLWPRLWSPEEEEINYLGYIFKNSILWQRLWWREEAAGMNFMDSSKYSKDHNIIL